MPFNLVPTWEAFESELRTIQSASNRSGDAPSLLFRGQSDDRWELSTTLERHGQPDCSFDEYYRMVLRTKPQVEAFTERSWVAPDYEEFRKWLNESGTLMPLGYPGYELIAYLRHHGFPSPLLDWTRSPYVAAYFAFAHSHPDAERVAMYVYCERPNRLKASDVGEPNIHVMGPFVSTHRRHFLQQCAYSVCIRPDAHQWRYASHEDVFRRGSATQDLLWKFSIPATERIKVLKLLDTYNLNAFSLFGSEDSLMQTIAFREQQTAPPAYEPFGTRVRIRLSPDEVARFRAPVSGNGGFQNLIRRIASSIDDTGVLEVSAQDVNSLVRYGFEYSEGGFQGRIRLDG